MPVHSSEVRARVREQVTGGKPSTAPANTQPLSSPLAAPLISWSAESTWDVWADPTLDLKSRSLVTVAVLATLGLPAPLAVHVRGALRNGNRPEEVMQALMHVAVYGGVSRAVECAGTVVTAIERYQAELRSTQQESTE